jgi:hypothetical protein
MTSAEDPLGTAAQEAGRLLDSLKQWLDARAPTELPIATGSVECKVCPVCLTIAALRDHNPEVVEQLAKAGESLLAAARSVLTDHEHEWVAGRGPNVERIDVDE